MFKFVPKCFLKQNIFSIQLIKRFAVQNYISRADPEWIQGFSRTLVGDQLIFLYRNDLNKYSLTLLFTF